MGVGVVTCKVGGGSGPCGNSATCIDHTHPIWLLPKENMENQVKKNCQWEPQSNPAKPSGGSLPFLEADCGRGGVKKSLGFGFTFELYLRELLERV